MRFEAFVKQFPDAKIKFDEPLSKYSNTKTGGPADVLVFPREVKELIEMVRFAQQHHYPYHTLGKVTNVIIQDGGMEGIIFLIPDLNKIWVEGDDLYAEAGASIIEASNVARDHGLTGLEFQCGIPGSIGGGIYMNAGAYDGKTEDVLESVEVIDEEGNLKTIPVEEMHFSYRHSIIQEKSYTILLAKYHLHPKEKQQITKRMEELTRARELKQPLELPSCGSVFKRPEGHYTGKLIQEAGLQGYCYHDVQVSRKHAGFIVNIGFGKGSDYVHVIRHVQEVIRQKNGIDLETEVRIIGLTPEEREALR